MRTTTINPRKMALNIFRQLNIRFEELDNFADLLSDVQTSLEVSLRENFSYLPSNSHPDYVEKVKLGVEGHLFCLRTHMEGLTYELDHLIEVSLRDQGVLMDDIKLDKETKLLYFADGDSDEPNS
jgi:hypothetical protein